MKIEKLSTRIGDESNEKINISLIIFVYMYTNFSIQSKKNLVKVDIIGKSGIKSYYVNFSNEQNLDSFEIYDTSD